MGASAIIAAKRTTAIMNRRKRENGEGKTARVEVRQGVNRRPCRGK